MRDRRRSTFLWCALFAAFWGVLTFFGVATNSRFETIHRLDVMRLMLVGATIPITIFFLIQFFRGPFSEDKRAGEKSREESN
jgi:hypothetical protein